MLESCPSQLGRKRCPRRPVSRGPSITLQLVQLHVADTQRLQRHARLQRIHRRHLPVPTSPDDTRQQTLHPPEGSSLHRLRRGQRRPPIPQRPSLRPVGRLCGQDQLQLVQPVQSLLISENHRNKLAPSSPDQQRPECDPDAGVLQPPPGWSPWPPSKTGTIDEGPRKLPPVVSSSSSLKTYSLTLNGI